MMNWIRSMKKRVKDEFNVYVVTLGVGSRYNEDGEGQEMFWTGEVHEK